MRRTILTLFLLSFSTYASDTLHIDPQQLREQLIENNLSVLAELHQLQQAKLQVNLARAQLLPSLNIGAILNPTGPSFVVSSAAFLLPFLVPSNWFNLRESKNLLEAEKSAFYLLQLNAYATAYSLYATINADRKLLEAQSREAAILQRIYDVVKTRYETIGGVTSADVAQARAQASMAQFHRNKMEELLTKEISSLRFALSLPLQTQITLADKRVPPSDFEGKELEDVLEKIAKLAPEKKQLDSLLAAARDARWSKIFGFLTGASVSGSSSGAEESVAFSPLALNSSMSLGFSLFPAIQLANGNIERIKLRQKELYQEQVRLVETAVKSLKLALRRWELALEAEAAFQEAYETEEMRFELGLTDLLRVYNAEMSMTNASIARINSEFDVDSLRIALHRVLLTEEFAKIPACDLTLEKKRGWLEEIVNPSASKKTIEELCGRKPAEHPTDRPR